jgi:hypothetical protein
MDEIYALIRCNHVIQIDFQPLDVVITIVSFNCNERSISFAITFRVETISKFSMNTIHYLQQLFGLKRLQL